MRRTVMMMTVLRDGTVPSPSVKTDYYSVMLDQIIIFQQ